MMKIILLAVLMLLAPTKNARALDNKIFLDVGINENLGRSLDRNLTFTDETGQTVTLGKYFDGHRPVSLSLVYYSCPGLCNFHLNNLIDSLQKIDWSIGAQFQVLAISFDPKETAELGAIKRLFYLEIYRRPEAESGLHFLTATQASVDQLTEQIGFKYKWNEEAQEWSHASAAVILSPEGKISRYLHGSTQDPQVFKMALNEATDGQLGSLIDKVILYLFKYDIQKSQYVISFSRLAQASAGLILLVLTIVFLMLWFKRRWFR